VEGDHNTQLEKPNKVMIFAETKRGADQLTRELRQASFPALAIHGDKTQQERDWVLAEFRSGRAPVMVATDVAARGIDVKDVGCVINYDFPNNVEDYVHRIGRTGRAGAYGVAYSFFAEDKGRMARELVDIMRQAGQQVSPELQGMVRYNGGGWGGRKGGKGKWGRKGSGKGGFGGKGGGFGGSGKGGKGGFGTVDNWRA